MKTNRRPIVIVAIVLVVVSLAVGAMIAWSVSEFHDYVREAPSPATVEDIEVSVVFPAPVLVMEDVWGRWWLPSLDGVWPRVEGPQEVVWNRPDSGELRVLLPLVCPGAPPAEDLVSPGLPDGSIAAYRAALSDDRREIDLWDCLGHESGTRNCLERNVMEGMVRSLTYMFPHVRFYSDPKAVMLWGNSDEWEKTPPPSEEQPEPPPEGTFAQLVLEHPDAPMGLVIAIHDRAKDGLGAMLLADALLAGRVDGANPADSAPKPQVPDQVRAAFAAFSAWRKAPEDTGLQDTLIEQAATGERREALRSKIDRYLAECSGG